MFSMTWKEWRQSITKLFKPRAKVRTKTTGRQQRTYTVYGFTKPFTVKALTKSEARAAVKKQCDISGRLPVGVALVEAKRRAA